MKPTKLTQQIMKQLNIDISNLITEQVSSDTKGIVKGITDDIKSKITQMDSSAKNLKEQLQTLILDIRKIGLLKSKNDKQYIRNTKKIIKQ